MKSRIFAIAIFALICTLSFFKLAHSNPQPKAEFDDTMFSAAKVKPVIKIAAYPFSLKQVRLLDGPFKQAMERDLKYILELDPDRLLHNFRLNAGLPSSAQPYGGWEKPDVELRGHTVGHYLSACAFMYASTGDERIKSRADSIVSELAKCQQALGTKGYLSAFPEEFFDRVESVRRVWAPYYTIHKIMAGLVDWYQYGAAARPLKSWKRWLPGSSLGLTARTMSTWSGYSTLPNRAA
jgi:DUF1680 family protein